MKWVRYAIASLFLLPMLASTAWSNPYQLQYGGRIVNLNGQPLAGPIDLDVRFFDSNSNATPLASQAFFAVQLLDGIFQVSINLSDIEFHTVFSASEVWIEITDVTNGKIYPRQKFSAVPYAFRIPVDEDSLGFDSNGRLTIKGIGGGTLPAGSPNDGQVLGWQNGNWTWVDELGSGGWPGSVNSSTIDDGSISNNHISSTAAIDQSKISGLIIDLSSKEPVVTAGTASQYWRGDKTWQNLDTSVVPENSNLYFTDERARNAVTATAPLSFNESTGVFSLPQATSISSGYLSFGDWLTFSNKQNSITAATTLNTGALTTAQQNAVRIQPYGTADGESGELRFLELTANGSNYVGFKAPNSIGTARIWTLPNADGGSGQCLVTDGSGNLSWADLGGGGGGGTITSIIAGTGLNGGTITSSGTIDLANTTVTAGAYSRANITVDAQGRLTAAANGGNIDLSSEVTDTLAIANGGTGASTEAAARTNLGLGALATLNTVTSSQITAGTITNSAISDSAAITDSKLATITTAGKVANSATTATSSNAANTIVARDADGNFIAGTITATLNGNASSATTATTAGNVTGTVAIANGGTGATTAAGARTAFELGALAVKDEVDSTLIKDGTIVNADIAPAAGIDSSKINFSSDSISGDAINGGTISNFASTGIDDNASATAVTIDSTGNVGIGKTNPVEKLDVNGVAKIGSGTSSTCSSASDGGKLRYNSSTGKMEYCDGVNRVWRAMFSQITCEAKTCTTTSACTASCSAGYKLTGIGATDNGGGNYLNVTSFRKSGEGVYCTSGASASITCEALCCKID